MRPPVLVAALCLFVLDSARALETSEFHDRWIGKLSSENSAEADQAVLKVFQGGMFVIQDLLKVSTSEKMFRGQFPFDDYESQMRTERPTVGVVALYLIQAICEKNLFFARPWIVPQDRSIKVHGSIPLSTPGAQEVAADVSTLIWRPVWALAAKYASQYPEDSLRSTRRDIV